MKNNQDAGEEFETNESDNEEPEAISLSFGKVKTIEQLKLERSTKNKAENEKKVWRKQKEDNRILHNKSNKRKFNEEEGENEEKAFSESEKSEEWKGQKKIFDNLEVVVLDKVGKNKSVGKKGNKQMNKLNDFIGRHQTKHKRISSSLVRPSKSQT
eukprot:TRINITY_DN639_c0_g1_i1.p1 TRINITY_DN639_c0_g1~~TRINITY_DN639_c0_g1_i1.p1  ORF type:complete len:156 (+),score=47.09 TRINITY_DN639_c0_g1_i1:157-624(+)